MDTRKRRLLFGGRLEIRPPWSVDQDLFARLCTRCDLCIQACPEKILVRDRAGYPRVDFSRGECTFCHACRDVCLDAARQEGRRGPFQLEDPPWQLVARIGPACLAGRGTLCRSCGDVCEVRAIGFVPVSAGFARPEVDENLCTGCGACCHVCPVGAIELD